MATNAWLRTQQSVNTRRGISTITKTYRATGGSFLIANHYLTSDQQEDMYKAISKIDADPAGPLIRETTSFWEPTKRPTGISNFILVTKLTSENQQKELEVLEDQAREEHKRLVGTASIEDYNRGLDWITSALDEKFE